MEEVHEAVVCNSISDYFRLETNVAYKGGSVGDLCTIVVLSLPNAWNGDAKAADVPSLGQDPSLGIGDTKYSIPYGEEICDE